MNRRTLPQLGSRDRLVALRTAGRHRRSHDQASASDAPPRAISAPIAYRRVGGPLRRRTGTGLRPRRRKFLQARVAGRRLLQDRAGRFRIVLTSNRRRPARRSSTTSRSAPASATARSPVAPIPRRRSSRCSPARIRSTSLVIGNHPYNFGCTDGAWTYMAVDAVGTDVLQHELGHVIAELFDEWVMPANQNACHTPASSRPPTHETAGPRQQHHIG